MYRTSAALFVLAGLLVAGRAEAAVVINEIAWMGTANGGTPAADSADEWIELANTSAEIVDLTGWALKAADGTPNVALAGSIPAGGFFLIERTDDESVPGVAADLIRSFGAGLSNSGETLVLTDASGEEVDRVEGGSGWASIGGDSSTKHTPQRTALGWVTAAPTPKAENVPPEGGVSEDPTESEDADPVETIGGSSSVYTPPPYVVPKLYIFPGPNRVVAVNAETPFRANVYDGFGRLRDRAEVTWTFGNGAKTKGNRVDHAYREPGEYLVVVRATVGQASAIRTLRVVAEPTLVSLDGSSGSGLHITNSGSRILDLSGWVLHAGNEQFAIPEDTALLPGSRVLFPAAITGLATSTAEVQLYYPGGTLAASYGTPQPQAENAGNQEVRALPDNAQAYGDGIGAPAAAKPAAAGAVYPPAPAPQARLPR